ncbi:imidazole glycerol phosphate synthase subunit HisH [Paralcaligenes ureilyticus]|uniref:imidazole glycerol phosphate synthase subunit HisH n=1 Tax=Paralcaligenes ureilyticus TaxID=627131 RepID=UPI0010538102|nr:imidazole glycerol phosphate synthase subunit HisH [Paralcaligenes ureilyticus]
MITIIDYGLGNISAFVNTYKRLNVAVSVAKTSGDLMGATKLILPGVGAFDYAMLLLKQSGMHDAVNELVTRRKVPVLGVCVGMQMLASSSEEGYLPGLGWIPGRVRRFDVSLLPYSTHLPHMGWNDVKPLGSTSLFAHLEKDARFYFLHSYYFECEQRQNVLAQTIYGDSFTCAVNHENVYGVQFHPEKSHHFGAQLLKNFSDL